MLHAIRQRLAFNQLQHKKANATGLFEVIDGRDIRMIKRRQYFSLALEAAHTIRIARELFRKDFDRNFTFEFRVVCPIHLTHAAFAKQAGDLVCAELSADSDRHLVPMET